MCFLPETGSVSFKKVFKNKILFEPMSFERIPSAFPHSFAPRDDQYHVTVVALNAA